jgi:outer membrane protein TolC
MHAYTDGLKKVIKSQLRLKNCIQYSVLSVSLLGPSLLFGADAISPPHTSALSQEKSLIDLWRFALENDKLWQQQQQELQVALQQEGINRADLLANVALSADASRVYPNSDTTEINDYSDRTYAVELQQPLYDAPAWYRLKATQATIKSQQINLDKHWPNGW